MLALLLLVRALSEPAPHLTPGAICTADSPDFVEHRYESVAMCRRRVPASVRQRVFASYGIPRERWHLYELDHLIPLCLGGANDARNLWPELWPHAKRKDVMEWRLCRMLRTGLVSQDVAIRALTLSEP